MKNDAHNISDQERKQRIVFSLMMLPSKMATEFQLSAKETRHWLETSYFHVLRQRGMTLDDVADHLDISKRKSSQLSEKLRTNFLAAEQNFGLPRRIEYLIWGEPISRKRVHQLLGNDYESEEVDGAIDALIAQDRIQVSEKELLQLSRAEARLYEDGFMARIDGLNHLVGVVFRAVLKRFVRGDEDAFARNLTFRIPTTGGNDALKTAYENLFKELAAIEETVPEDDPGIPVDLSVLWAARDLQEPK